METATRTSTRTTASPSRGVELAFLLPGGERLSSRPYPVTTFGDLRRSLWDEAHHDQEDEAEDEDDKDTKERRRRLAAALVNVAHVDRLKLLYLGRFRADQETLQSCGLGAGTMASLHVHIAPATDHDEKYTDDDGATMVEYHAGGCCGGGGCTIA